MSLPLEHAGGAWALSEVLPWPPPRHLCLPTHLPGEYVKQAWLPPGSVSRLQRTSTHDALLDQISTRLFWALLSTRPNLGLPCTSWLSLFGENPNSWWMFPPPQDLIKCLVPLFLMDPLLLLAGYACSVCCVQSWALVLSPRATDLSLLTVSASVGTLLLQHYSSRLIQVRNGKPIAVVMDVV